MSREIKESDRLLEWLLDISMAVPEDRPDSEIAARVEAIGEMIAETDRLRHKLERQSLEVCREMAEVLEERCAEKGLPIPDFYEPDPRDSATIELVDAEAGPCVHCGREAGVGLVGWSRDEPDTGPLCDRCLGNQSVDLGAAMGLVNAMRQLTAETEDPDRGWAAMTTLLDLARRYAQATAGTWPLRPVGVESLLETVHEKMEERHGMFWLNELERAGRSGDGEPN